MPTHNDSSMICGGTEAFTSTTFFRQVVEKLAQEDRKCYIMKTQLDTPLSKELNQYNNVRIQ